jgi:hypothetical protein
LSTFAEIAAKANEARTQTPRDLLHAGLALRFIEELADKMAYLDPPDPHPLDPHLVDRVAKALWWANRAAWESPKHWEWEQVTGETRDRHRRMARAALAAMGKETG